MKFEAINQEEKESKMKALRELVTEAIMSAPDEDELRESKDKKNEKIAMFNRKEISYEDLERELKDIGMPGGVIRTNELMELMDILRIIGLGEEQVKEMVAHENDHCAKAISLGMDPIYQIQFSRTKGDDRLSIYPSVALNMPEEMPDDEKTRILKEIAGAVEKLSPSDKKQLQ